MSQLPSHTKHWSHRRERNTLGRYFTGVKIMDNFSDDDSATYAALLGAWRASSTRRRVKQREAEVAGKALRDGTGEGPSALLLSECARLNALYEVDHAALKAFMRLIFRRGPDQFRPEAAPRG